MGTEVVAQGNAEVAVATNVVEGLEDFDSNLDAQMPILRIKHDSGQFVDALSGETINESGEAVEVILLGLMKQRILWASELSDDAKPLCKSYNFTEGVPDEDNFPKKASGFTSDDVDGGMLPCVDCKLKEWGSHPQRDTPWCSEQHTFALLVKTGDGWSPALLTVQRSAIKPSKQYLTSFARSGTPLYTVVTSISLDQRRKGTVDFSVPKFVRGAETDSDDWPAYAATYRGIREFVRTPQSRNGGGGEDGGENETPVAKPTKVAADKPKPAPEPDVDEDVIDEAVVVAEDTAPDVPTADAEEDLPF